MFYSLYDPATDPEEALHACKSILVFLQDTIGSVPPRPTVGRYPAIPPLAFDSSYGLWVILNVLSETIKDIEEDLCKK